MDKSLVYQTYSIIDYRDAASKMTYNEFLAYAKDIQDFIERQDDKYLDKDIKVKIRALYQFVHLSEYYVRTNGVGVGSDEDIANCEYILKSIYRNQGLERE